MEKKDFVKNEGKIWTREENTRLINEIKKQYPLFMIAQNHQRTFISVKNQLVSLLEDPKYEINVSMIEQNKHSF